MKKDVKKMLKKHGVTEIGTTKRGHIKVVVHGSLIISSGTPSDIRSNMNFEAAIKRAKKTSQNS